MATGGGRWAELLGGRSLDLGGGVCLAATCEFAIDTADSRSDALDLALKDSIAFSLGVAFRGIGDEWDDIPLSLSSASMVELEGVLEREGSRSVDDEKFSESVVLWRVGVAGERDRTGVGDGVTVGGEIISSGSTRAGIGRDRVASLGFSARSSRRMKRKSSPNSSSSCNTNEHPNSPATVQTDLLALGISNRQSVFDDFSIDI